MLLGKFFGLGVSRHRKSLLKGAFEIEGKEDGCCFPSSLPVGGLEGILKVSLGTGNTKKISHKLLKLLLETPKSSKSLLEIIFRKIDVKIFSTVFRKVILAGVFGVSVSLDSSMELKWKMI